MRFNSPPLRPGERAERLPPPHARPPNPRRPPHRRPTARRRHGLARGDLLVRDGVIADLGAALGRPDGVDDDRRRAAPSSAPAWSTCARPSASPASNTAKPSPPPPSPPRPAASPRSPPCPIPAPPSTTPPWCACCARAARRPAASPSCPTAPSRAAAAGEELAELGLLREAGAVAFTDGGRAIGPARLMRLALSYARGFGAPHRPAPGGPEPRRRRRGDRGRTRHPPRPARHPRRGRGDPWSRATSGSRALTGGAVHFAHVSTAEALELIRARQGGRASRSPATPPRPISTSTRRRSATSAPTPSSRRRCAPKPTGWRSSRRSPTARSTPSPATTSRATPTTSACPSPRPPPAAPASRRCSAVTLAQVHAGALTLPQAIALLTDRPGAPARLRGRHAGEGRAGRSLPVPPRARLAGRSRQAAGQGAEHAVRRPRAGGPGDRHLESRAPGVRMTRRALLAAALGYLLGSIPFGLLLTRAAGLGDIRADRLAATSARPTCCAPASKGLAAATLLLDGGKGAAAVLLGCASRAARRRRLGRRPRRRARPSVPGLARLPRRQGRGHRLRRAARRRLAGRRSLAGAVWLIVVAAARASPRPARCRLRRRAGAGAALADAARRSLVLALAVAVLVFVRHHANIRRLLAGTEPRIGRRSMSDDARPAPAGAHARASARSPTAA